MADFANDVVLLTEGGDDLGRTLVQTLVARGARVVFALRGPASDAPEGSIAVAVEGWGRAAVEPLVAAALERWGRVDVLLNHALHLTQGGLGEITLGDWNATLERNLDAVYHAARVVLKPMTKGRYGRIVNITGLQGLAGSYGQAAYAAASGGVIGLTHALARETAPWNITVNAVALGLIEGDILARLPAEVQRQGLNVSALRRVGTLAEAIAPILFLASREASFLSGQVVSVDGGWMMA